jgi:uncharacterized protein YhaN
VKIDRLRVDGFGRLSGLDTGPEPLGGLVVVLGPNEAGKSTLFTFLTSMLYGFKPASRDSNPHIPWGSSEAGGEVRFRLEGDQCAVVERVLRSTPAGTLAMSGTTLSLRNQPVPWVEHIPRTVFRQVFAVTLSELAGLDQDTWARISDRVLGSMGATDLRSARVAAELLEKDAGEIWRPNRRGKQRLREVQGEIRTLRSRRHDALERDTRMRALVDERDNVLVQLAEERKERQRHKIDLERIQELLPVKRQLDRIAALRADGGDRAELRGMPADPRAVLETMDAEALRLEHRRSTLEEDARAPATVLAQFDSGLRALLEHEERVSTFLLSARAVEADRTLAADLTARVRELSVQTDTAASHLMDGPVDDAVLACVARISADLLSDRIERLESLRRLIGARAAGGRSELVRFALPVGLAPVGLALPVGLAVSGAVLLGWGILGGPSATTSAGAALLAVAATLTVLRALRPKAPGPSSDGSSSESDSKRLAAEIARSLSDVPIRKDLLEHPSRALPVGLRRLQEVAVDLDDTGRRLETVSDRIGQLNDDAHALTVEIGWAADELGDCEGGAGGLALRLEEFALRLDREIRQAKRARNAAENAERDAEGLARSLSRLSDELAEVEAERTSLHDRMAASVDGDPRTVVDRVQMRVEAHARADRLTEELERSHPDLALLEARIRDVERGGRPLGEDGVDAAELNARVEVHDAAIEELVSRAKALERDAAHLGELETTDAVDSAILHLQEAEAALTKERDRKWILAQLIREADRRFREEHQPDLIRRASGYLANLTGGRYEGLLLDEHGDGDLFQLVGPGLPRPIALAAPISTGTLEQAYLSLRLAIVDHLDKGTERLPLFIDEAFVNWDDERRDRGLAVLSKLSESRQVFAFTCHPEMALRLESLGARVLSLER